VFLLDEAIITMPEGLLIFWHFSSLLSKYFNENMTFSMSNDYSNAESHDECLFVFEIFAALCEKRDSQRIKGLLTSRATIQRV
jgi:hypothetical protein